MIKVWPYCKIFSKCFQRYNIYKIECETLKCFTINTFDDSIKDLKSTMPYHLLSWIFQGLLAASLYAYIHVQLKNCESIYNKYFSKQQLRIHSNSRTLYSNPHVPCSLHQNKCVLFPARKQEVDNSDALSGDVCKNIMLVCTGIINELFGEILIFVGLSSLKNIIYLLTAEQ